MLLRPLSLDLSQDGTATQKTFMHVPSSIEAEEAEEIGVEHLLRDVKNLSVGTLSSRVADQLSSLRGLQSRLGEIKTYLEAVVAGKLPVNHQIIYNLQDVFNLLPNLDAAVQAGEGPEGARRPFTVATNDQVRLIPPYSILLQTTSRTLLSFVSTEGTHSSPSLSFACRASADLTPLVVTCSTTTAPGDVPLEPDPGRDRPARPRPE